MIPKIIHYCWFGNNPLPDLAQKCIASWRKYFPDYEIWQWSEEPLNTNVNTFADKVLGFDVNIIPYTKEAYEAKKYAFVSDYARFWILYREGGLYFDTDVEVIKPFDNIITRGSFMGCEKPAHEGATPMQLGVNPGLGIGAPLGLDLFKQLLNEYSSYHFLNEDGSFNKTTIVEYTSQILCKHGLRNTPDIQQVADVWIYPHDYFAPKNVDTKELVITEDTVSIHHYDSSWAEWYEKAAGERGPKLRRLLGNWLGARLNSGIYIYQRWGLIGCIKKIFFR